MCKVLTVKGLCLGKEGIMIFEKKVVNAFKGAMHTRCDDTETVFYFSADDFEGLRKEPYFFTSSMGHELKGYFYSYENPIEGRLVVFDHGFGGGHRAYMKEIELLCRHGFKVFSYDHTGCMESGGATPNGMTQSLCDLNDCLNAIKADERFSSLDLSVMGHSWGGFSTLNISALHPDISHVVVLSGFVSAEELTNTFFSGIMKGYRKAILALEREANPVFVKYHAVESLKDSNAKILLVYSDNDTLCRKKHYDILKSGLADKANVEFMLVEGKGHNPNYTADAVKYLGEFVKARAKFNKKATAEEKAKFVASFDWERMTAQDSEVWKRIFEALDA